MSGPIRVLCMDDNPHVGEALRIKLALAGGFEWVGWLSTADNLVARAREAGADVVLVDIDAPGRSPFEAMAELAAALPTARVIMFSGHVRPDLIDRAVEAGAWGYLSKNDSEEALIDAIRRVAGGEFVLGPEPAAVYELG